MAWTYLGLQYKIFPATPSAVLATKGFLFFIYLYIYIEVLFLLGQLNILEFIFVCCRVRWISSGRWRVTVLPLSSQQIVWTFSSGCTRVTVSCLSPGSRPPTNTALCWNTSNNHQWIQERSTSYTPNHHFAFQRRISQQMLTMGWETVTHWICTRRAETGS